MANYLVEVFFQREELTWFYQLLYLLSKMLRKCICVYNIRLDFMLKSISDFLLYSLIIILEELLGSYTLPIKLLE